MEKGGGGGRSRRGEEGEIGEKWVYDRDAEIEMGEKRGAVNI